MKMRKRILGLILCICLIGVAAGCGDADSDKESVAANASVSESEETVQEFLDASDTMERGEMLVVPKDEDIPEEADDESVTNGLTLADFKLQKEQARAKNRETLLEFVNNEELTDEQRQEAVDSLVEMTAIAEKEAAAEILLEAKGYTNALVILNGDMVDVVVIAPVLDDVMSAQIEDIVKRKTEVSVENINIIAVDE